MADRNAVIGVDIQADGKKAAQAFDATADAAEAMGKAIAAAGDQAARGSHDVGRAAEATDNLASKSSQATGGLGALASGFELVGLGPYAVGLQSAAMATDFFSGVGDIANLVLESQAVQTVKNTALKIKDAVVTKGQAVATGIMTGAQWALNAAMSANPIGIVIAAIVALTAVFIIAYKKSDTFRRIVNNALEAVKTVAGNVVGWLKQHWPLILAILTGPFGLAVLAIAKNWAKIKSAALGVVGFFKDTVAGGVKNAVDNIVGTIAGLPGRITNLAGKFVASGKAIIGKFLDGLGQIGHDAADIGTAIINGIIDAINVGIQVINDILPNDIGLGPVKIDFPDNPLPPIGHVGGGSSKVGAGDVTTSAPSNPTVSITVQGAVDPMSTAKQIKDLLDRSDRWSGGAIGFAQ